MRRCVWCGELRDRTALPAEARVCRCCASYAAQRVRWYGIGWALPVGLQLRSATEAAPVVRRTSYKRRAA